MKALKKYEYFNEHKNNSGDIINTIIGVIGIFLFFFVCTQIGG